MVKPHGYSCALPEQLVFTAIQEHQTLSSTCYHIHANLSIYAFLPHMKGSCNPFTDTHLYLPLLILISVLLGGWILVKPHDYSCALPEQLVFTAIQEHQTLSSPCCHTHANLSIHAFLPHTKGKCKGYTSLQGASHNTSTLLFALTIKTCVALGLLHLFYLTKLFLLICLLLYPVPCRLWSPYKVQMRTIQ